MEGNRERGSRLHDALIKAGEAKVDAIQARKKADRILDVCFLRADGKNAEMKKAQARTDPTFLEADKLATDAECAAILAKADADGLQIRFEAWRTEESTKRAEMTLR
jgi:hypothetical protein